MKIRSIKTRVKISRKLILDPKRIIVILEKILLELRLINQLQFFQSRPPGCDPPGNSCRAGSIFVNTHGCSFEQANWFLYEIRNPECPRLLLLSDAPAISRPRDRERFLELL